MPDSEDRLLLKQLAAGGRAALRRIYEKYRSDLFAISVSLLADIDLAEDCLQDAFVRLTEAAPRLKIRGDLRAYLISCVVNRARDCLRRQLRCLGSDIEHTACAAPSPSPVQRLLDDEQAAALIDALAALPAEQRETFVLYARAGLSFRDIAAMQKVSLRTAHSRYRYAIDKLRGLLARDNEK